LSVFIIPDNTTKCLEIVGHCKTSCGKSNECF